MLREQLAEAIVAAVQPTPMTLDEAYNALVEPPQPEMGDLAFGCFILSKQLKKSPAQVATELAQKIQPNADIQSVQAAGPYLNFRFTLKSIGQHLLEPVLTGEYFKRKLTIDSPKTMIEYSQPNTHKELHVGHMRNLCLGDALVRILKYDGFDLISSTFPGDVGTHVAKCLWYMKYHNQEPEPAVGKGEWLGRMYSLANNKLEDEDKTPKGEENKKHLTEILKQLEHKNGEYFELWKKTRAWSIELMQKVYEWADVKFDKWYWESDVDADSAAYIRKLYQDKNVVIESKGALGVDLESYNMGFCLLLKTDGTGLYATKDIELARRKFQDFKIEKSIYVVDMRQALHFKQVFKVLELLGFEEAKNCFHLQYNFVELPDGAMSSRKGNIIPITALIQKMENTVKEQYLNKFISDWGEAEVNLAASQVAKGAIKYGMLRMDTGKKIVFDMNEWLKIDGESGPFIQYSTARINSLCKKLGFAKGPVNAELLVTPPERFLLQHLMNFNMVAMKVSEDLRPSVLCTYLYETAKKFNYFYHECSIGQAETEELKRARLALAYATGQVLRKGLELLGIPAPERM